MIWLPQVIKIIIEILQLIPYSNQNLIDFQNLNYVYLKYKIGPNWNKNVQFKF